MVSFHRKKRPVWKSCRNCTNVVSGFGISDQCRFCGKEVNFFVWTKWDECELFFPEQNCLTCNKYEECTYMQGLIICDKKRRCEDLKPCAEYESNTEMLKYIEKNAEKHKANKMFKGCK